MRKYFPLLLIDLALSATTTYWRKQICAFARRDALRTRMLALGLAMLMAAPSFGVITEYWVDSKSTTAHTGTQSQPWLSVGSSQMTTINTALASGPVTVYIAGRLDSSDAEQFHSSTGSSSVADAIDPTLRTDTSANRLTFDGTTYYNTSHTTPNWMPNTGTNRARILTFNAQNGTHTKYSYIKAYGLHIKAPSSGKIASVCGDHIIFDNCDMEHIDASGASGPGFMITPTADAAHQGTDFYAPPLTDILITNCIIHKTWGEAMYIGGGGTTFDAAGGYPSHTDIRIVNNKIFDAGFWGAQGDGIDIKGGIGGLLVKGNEIYNTGTSSEFNRPIVMQGNVNGSSTEISGNWLHDNLWCEDAAIAIVDSWGVQYGTLIANNLLSTNTRSSSPSSAAGIKIYATTGTVTNVHNTIYKSGYVAVVAVNGSHVQQRNNLFISNNSGGAQLEVGGSATMSSDYNGWTGSSLGYAGELSHSFSTTAAANFTDVANGDFTLKSTAPARDAGITVTMVPLDYLGVTRDATPDLGVYEYSSGGGGGSSGGTAPSSFGGTRMGGVVFK